MMLFSMHSDSSLDVWLKLHSTSAQYIGSISEGQPVHSQCPINQLINVIGKLVYI